MIDALFGSKTRVKLMHLFLNNPGKAFYVREITRLVDEQINSVRRELSNMLEVGVINSDSYNNKLYYEINQRYDHYAAFRAIFADKQVEAPVQEQDGKSWHDIIKQLPGIRLAVLAGVLVKGSASSVDLLVVGSIPSAKLKQAVKKVESLEGRELNYSVLSYDEFYYRLSVRDKFINEMLTSKHTVLFDSDNILKTE